MHGKEGGRDFRKFLAISGSDHIWPGRSKRTRGKSRLQSLIEKEYSGSSREEAYGK
jgi:hypothetical protein